jgi:type II secretory pathway pseudopilin PulG
VRSGRRAGLTLVELLVVGAIVAVIGAAVAAMLAGGLRVWERAHAEAKNEAALAIGFDILERDVRNAFAFYGIPFQGRAASVSFSGLVAAGGAQGRGPERIGTIRYAFDVQRQAVLRQTWLFPGAQPDSAGAEALLSGIAEWTLTYLRGTREGAFSGWQNSWEGEHTLPLAVRVEWRAAADPGAESRRRTIFLADS